MSRSAISPTPVRLILKMGDDLRQDMITLRMLALFDKVCMHVFDYNYMKSIGAP